MHTGLSKNSFYSEQPMLLALQGQVTPRMPIWLMRQAGRYLPEYRALRTKAGSFLNLCFSPEMAVEITLQPLRRFDLDAAILFSDILVIPYALGQKLEFLEGEGPVLPPLDNLSALRHLNVSGFEERLLPVYETLSSLRKVLPEEKTLIGFAGAPWTIACYMLHGRGGGKFDRAVQMALSDPEKFDVFLTELADITATYLISQIRHGADTVQIFDSWAGLVPDAYFDRYVIVPTERIVSRIKAVCPQVPVIGFPRQARQHYARYARKTGVDALGLDPQTDIAALPKELCLQGNLAPEVLLAGGDILREGVSRIMEAAAGRPFVFNLGHGVIKETPPEHVADLIALVRSHTHSI